MTGSWPRMPCGPCSHTIVDPCPARNTLLTRPSGCLTLSLASMPLLRRDTDGCRPLHLDVGLRPPAVLMLAEAIAQLRHHVTCEPGGVVERGLHAHVAELA